MSLRQQMGQWLVPPGFHPLIRRVGLKAAKDTNATITPVQLRHIRRYDFARASLLGTTVLDAACGSGYGSDLLEPLERYVGLDYADYCITYARENYGGENRSFVEGDLYALESTFSRSSFDTVVCFETLEHLENPERVLRAFCDVLKPTGRLIMSIPLNHPDLVYHKRRYAHADVRRLLGGIMADREATLEEYLQQHLVVSPLAGKLSLEKKGTWLGVLTLQR